MACSIGLCLTCIDLKVIRQDSRCSFCCNAAVRASYKRHKDRKKNYSKAYGKQYRAVNKVQLAEKYKSWHKQNLYKVLAKNATRRARLLQACPKWISKIHLAEIRLMYKNRPIGYHVDHIIPLKGENVSGLHVPWNLQYLSAYENISKKNRVA